MVFRFCPFKSVDNTALEWISRTQSKLDLEPWRSLRQIGESKKLNLSFFSNQCVRFFSFIFCKLANNQSATWKPGQCLSLNVLQIHSTSALCTSSYPFIDETRRSCCSHCRLSLHALRFFAFQVCGYILFLFHLKSVRSFWLFLLSSHSFGLLPVYLVCWPQIMGMLKGSVVFLSYKILGFKRTSYLTRITTGIGNPLEEGRTVGS